MKMVCLIAAMKLPTSELLFSSSMSMVALAVSSTSNGLMPLTVCFSILCASLSKSLTLDLLASITTNQSFRLFNLKCFEYANNVLIICSLSSVTIIVFLFVLANISQPSRLNPAMTMDMERMAVVLPTPGWPARTKKL